MGCSLATGTAKGPDRASSSGWHALRRAGMTNGNTFRKLMGNSPGGILAQRVQGQPPIYLSAGLQDSIFPIAQAGDAVCTSPLAPCHQCMQSCKLYAQRRPHRNTSTSTCWNAVCDASNQLCKAAHLSSQQLQHGSFGSKSQWHDAHHVVCAGRVLPDGLRLQRHL